MAAEIVYFSTCLSAEYVNTLKSYLDALGIFDSVTMNTSTYEITCTINSVDVFKMYNSGKHITFTSTGGTTVFDSNDDGHSYAGNPCYIAKADNDVYFSTGNGNSLREFILGKKGTNPYWMFWYSNSPSSEANAPKGAFFSANAYNKMPFQSATNAQYSRACAAAIPSATSIAESIEVYQFMERQSTLVAINGGTTPYCYRVGIDGRQFVTSGQFLIPYTD